MYGQETYKENRNYFNWYFIAPKVLAIINMVAIFIWAIVDVSVFQGYNRYGVMRIKDPFLAVFIWLVIAAVISIILYVWLKRVFSFKILIILNLEAICENTVKGNAVEQGDANDAGKTTAMVSPTTTITSTQSKSSSQQPTSSVGGKKTTASIQDGELENKLAVKPNNPQGNNDYSDFSDFQGVFKSSGYDINLLCSFDEKVIMFMLDEFVADIYQEDCSLTLDEIDRVYNNIVNAYIRSMLKINPDVYRRYRKAIQQIIQNKKQTTSQQPTQNVVQTSAQANLTSAQQKPDDPKVRFEGDVVDVESLMRFLEVIESPNHGMAIDEMYIQLNNFEKLYKEFRLPISAMQYKEYYNRIVNCIC